MQATEQESQAEARPTDLDLVCLIGDEKVSEKISLTNQGVAETQFNYFIERIAGILGENFKGEEPERDNQAYPH